MNTNAKKCFVHQLNKTYGQAEHGTKAMPYADAMNHSLKKAVEHYKLLSMQADVLWVEITFRRSLDGYDIQYSHKQQNLATVTYLVKEASNAL